MDDTSITTSTNPVKVTIPASKVLVVGRCSDDRDTCCDADADCTGDGATCNKPKEGDRQLTILTCTWVWGSGTGTNETYFYIKNLTDYPSP